MRFYTDDYENQNNNNPNSQQFDDFRREDGFQNGTYNDGQPFTERQTATYVVGDPSIIKGKKKLSKNMIIGIVVFAVYFIVMTFLVFTNKCSSTTVYASIGSNIFAVIGFVFFITKNYRIEYLTYLLFPMAAFVVNGFILYSFIAKLSYYELKDTAFKFMLILGGIFYIVASIIRYINKKKYCTMDVEAYVVGYDISGQLGGGKRDKKRAPIYEFYYNGFPFRVKSDKYKEMFYTREGTRVVIKIDPNDPKHFYEEHNDNVVLKVIGALAVIAFGIFSLIVLK